jgi:fermentation-respiration switch protein FrsA (DUF1100 family)
VNTKPAKLSQSGWMRLWWLTRPLFIAYLVIVLGMMFLETWLVYPIPPLSWGDWNPKGFAYEDVHFASADGTKLNGWFFDRRNAKRAILYCHGNGEDIANIGELASYMSRKLDASVFIFDYRGYGHSEGRPNEAGCIADGSAAQQWLANRMGLQPNEVILMGRSLGGAIGVALAAENGARALVLENAFPTMPDVAAAHYPWLPVRWVMKNRYDNLERIKRYGGPLIQCHGCADNLIPIEMARTLHQAAPSKTKKWLEFERCGHNDAQPPSYYDALAGFLDGVDTSSEVSQQAKAVD